LPATPVSIGTATLDAVSFDATLGSLDAAGSAVINLGSGSNLVFADSSAVSWTDGTLTITGDFVSGSSIRFGNSNTALTATQLGLISVNGSGVGTFTLDTNGYLVSGGANNYASWASSQVPPVTGGPDGDFDNDGVKNLIEYALADGQERGTLTGPTLTFTKRGLPWGSDLTYEIETSPTLQAGSWTTLGKPPVTENAGSISYTLTPGTPPRNFARLKVIQHP
jgi:hypothetical protein